MKPTVLDNIQRSGNLGGVQHKMTFDEQSIAHIMSILTDLYSDPLLAIIREYSTNALDSHIEKGINKPIEVSTPTGLLPQFVVKDYGVGLSAEDIENIYSKYGKSTKRETNEQVGMLGLGCKSALTYTAQFMLTGVKNGMKTFVSISRNNDGTGIMEVIDSSPTNDPDGVIVAIPVQAKDFTSINQKAKAFFRFWQPGTVLLDGKDPSNFGDMIVGHRCYVVDGLPNDYIVMGNVSYPVSNKLYDNSYYRRDFGVVAFVDIGEVHFTPSREDLHYTDKTNQTIRHLKQEFSNGINDAISRNLESCASFPEAVDSYIAWSRRFSGKIFKPSYKGLQVLTDYRFDGLFFNSDGRKYAVNAMAVTDRSMLKKAIVITGFEGDTITPNLRSKIRLWASTKGHQIYRFILVKDMFGLPWTSDVTTVHVDEIKAMKLVRVKSGVKREATYDVFNKDTGYFSKRVIASEIDTTKPIYYISRSEKPIRWSTLTSRLGDVTLVELSKNRWDLFKKRFANAVHIHDLIKQEMDASHAALNDKDKYDIAMNWHAAQVLRQLDENLIEDPTIKDAIIGAKGKTIHSPNKLNFSAWLKISQEFGLGYPRVTVDNPLNKYPLLPEARNFNKEHAYIYINTIYNMSKETK